MPVGVLKNPIMSFWALAKNLYPIEISKVKKVRGPSLRSEWRFFNTPPSP